MSDKIKLSDDEKKLLEGSGGPAKIPSSVTGSTGPDSSTSDTNSFSGAGAATGSSGASGAPVPTGLQANPEKGAVDSSDAAPEEDTAGGKKKGRRKKDEPERADKGEEADVATFGTGVAGSTVPVQYEQGEDGAAPAQYK